MGRGNWRACDFCGREHGEGIVCCHWCGASVHLDRLGAHMDGHHKTQRIYRPFSKSTATLAQLLASEEVVEVTTDATEVQS